MPFIKNRLTSYLPNPESLLKKPFSIFCGMFGFWCFFDSMVTFLVPIKMDSLNFSPGLIGIMFAISAVASLLFDLLSLKIFKNIDYKKIFFLMFGLCFTYPIILFFTEDIIIMLIPMILWGVYLSLNSLGDMDYIGRRTSKRKFTAEFSRMQLIAAISYLLAPAIAALLIFDGINIKPFLLANLAILISFIFFKELIKRTKKDKKDDEENTKKVIDNKIETKTITKITKILSPLLIMNTTRACIISYFETLGALLAISIFTNKLMIGSIVIANIAPALFIGLIIKKTAHKNKKLVASLSIIFGSICLASLFLINNPYLILLVIFMASSFFAILGPTIDSRIADYVNESPTIHSEVEVSSNLSLHIGFIIGPLAAGLSAQLFGYKNAFVVVGLFSLVIGLITLRLKLKNVSVVKQLDTVT